MGKRQRRRDGVKEAFWRAQVEGQARSGLGVRAFCQQQALAENSFYAWRRELTVRDREQAAAAGGKRIAAAQKNTVAQPAMFTEVLVTAPAQPLTAPTAPIEIILTSQRRIAVAPGFDPATLRAVMNVLEDQSC